MTTNRSYRIAQILLTLGCLEFFGPIIKDTGMSHLMNPEWVGHARIHLGWLLGFMFFSGLANLYLIWIKSPQSKSNLNMSVLWQGAHLLGFWGSVAFSPLYNGQLVDMRYHTYILGIEENVFVFAIMTIILLIAIYWIRFKLTESPS